LGDGTQSGGHQGASTHSGKDRNVAVLGELGLLASHDRLSIGIEAVKLIAGLGHFNLGFGLAKVLLSVASLLVPVSNSLRHSLKLGVALVCMGAGSLSL
jgi:hypothetical protein